MAENLRRLASVPLLRTPGIAWEYSLSIDVLGAVMERAAGKELPLIVAELVTGQLSMRDTAFRVVDRARLAAPYVDGPPPVRMTDPQTELARAAMSNQIGALAGPMPGFGFGYGGAVLLDPQAAQTPQNSGTWLWGGVYGHSWFVDPGARVTCVLLTNTALEGMIGRPTFDLRNAAYDSLTGEFVTPKSL